MVKIRNFVHQQNKTTRRENGLPKIICYGPKLAKMGFRGVFQLWSISLIPVQCCWMTCNWTDSGFSRWHLAPAPVTSFIQTKVWSIQSKKLHHHVTSNISKCWLLLSVPSLLVGCGGGGSKETLLLLEPEIFHSCREYSCFKMSFALVMKSILSFADRKIGSSIPSLSLNF